MAIHVKNPPRRSDRVLNLALWGVQILVFISFATAAWMKITFPIPKLAGIWSWAGALSPFEVRGLGVIDLLGGLGLVLPMLTGIGPRLTVAAAVGCAVLQVCAASFHVMRGEAGVISVNIVLLAMVLFIAWGRTRSRTGVR